MLDRVRTHLLTKFPKTHVEAMLKHYVKMTGDFQASQWENAIVKGGKFVEAALKAIATVAGVPFSTGRAFAAGKIIDDLGRLTSGSTHDSLRLLLPRASRLAYEIASNRGARHDPGEVDPNESDATVVMATCSWMCGEMIRVATGAVSLDEAQKLVDGLAEKRYPILEEVDGRLWFHGKKAKPREVALVILSRVYPKRMTREDLLGALERHRVRKVNAQVVITRLKSDRLVDDGPTGLYLLGPGRQLADEVLRESGQKG
jgi:hypothetical protein